MTRRAAPTEPAETRGALGSEADSAGQHAAQGWRRSSTVSEVPPDPVGEAVAESITEILEGAVVELVYSPAGARRSPPEQVGTTTATASGDGPPGWRVTCIVRLEGPLAAVVTPDSTRLVEILSALPSAALQAATRFRGDTGGAQRPLTPSMRRALRDSLVVEVLAEYRGVTDAHRPRPSSSPRPSST